MAAPLALALATLAVVLLQHAINLFNDAADWRLGADVEKHDSWVRVHGDDPRKAALHGLASLLLGGVIGLGVLAWFDSFAILWWAAPMVALGYLYNAGPRPLSYTFLGEWVTGLCYGPGVFACLWLVAGLAPDWGMAVGSIAFAALAVSLLLSHQPPQIETDRAAGKQSFAVRYGALRTRRVARGLFMLFLTSLVLGMAVQLPPWLTLIGAGVAAVAASRLATGAVNPKRILLPASTAVLVLLVVISIAAWGVGGLDYVTTLV